MYRLILTAVIMPALFLSHSLLPLNFAERSNILADLKPPYTSERWLHQNRQKIFELEQQMSEISHDSPDAAQALELRNRILSLRATNRRILTLVD